MALSTPMGSVAGSPERENGQGSHRWVISLETIGQGLSKDVSFCLSTGRGRSSHTVNQLIWRRERPPGPSERRPAMLPRRSAAWLAALGASLLLLLLPQPTAAAASSREGRLIGAPLPCSFSPPLPAAEGTRTGVTVQRAQSAAALEWRRSRCSSAAAAACCCRVVRVQRARAGGAVMGSTHIPVPGAAHRWWVGDGTH